MGRVKIQIKRIYAGPSPSDGRRILIDLLWPRGMSKEKAHLDFWAKSVAPSTKLRLWYRHDPKKWPEFRRRYFVELDDNPEGIDELRSKLGSGTVTFLYGSREEKLNNAAALRDYLTSHRKA
jgi:uncharacterized protein YeaO (DUF488 family)